MKERVQEVKRRQVEENLRRRIPVSFGQSDINYQFRIKLFISTRGGTFGTSHFTELMIFVLSSYLVFFIKRVIIL